MEFTGKICENVILQKDTRRHFKLFLEGRRLVYRNNFQGLIEELHGEYKLE